VCWCWLSLGGLIVLFVCCFHACHNRKIIPAYATFYPPCGRSPLLPWTYFSLPPSGCEDNRRCARPAAEVRVSGCIRSPVNMRPRHEFVRDDTVRERVR